MNFIDLDTAIAEITQACRRPEGIDRSPFFFVVGAGISSPAIPLARELVAKFREEALKNGKEDEPQVARGLDEYDYWFQAAYPQRRDRQAFLRSLIEKQPVTHANLRLAHLLLNATITNMVVTPNFDDFLTKSLQLFGKYHLTCDHPKTIERIYHEQDDVQIVHVHGTYSFYDCCNLKAELESRAQPSLDSYTMGFLLDQILYRRSPLVIGYSGWEGDVIMTALKKRLEQGLLPHRVYWFCYRKSDIELLPRWLRARGLRAGDDISFVVRNTEECVGTEGVRDAAGGQRREYADEKTVVHNILEAEDVFASMIRAFGLSQPLLTSDPLVFLAEHLRALLPNVPSRGEDPYFIPTVISRIERAKTLDAEASERTRVSEAALEEVREAVRRADYREGVAKAVSILVNPELSTAVNFYELMDAYWLAIRGLDENSQEKLDAYDSIMFCYRTVLSRKEDLYFQVRLATALIERGLTVRQLNKNEEALASFDEVMTRFGESVEPALLGEVARSLVNKANCLADLDRNEEALAVYDEVLRRFSESEEPVLREAVARTLNNKGHTLALARRQTEAIDSFDQVEKRFGKSIDSSLREQVGGALIRKAQWLNEWSMYDEAVAVSDNLISRFGASSELALCKEVAIALIKKAAALLALRRPQEAIASLDEIIDRFGEAPELVLQEDVAFALFGRGIIFQVSGRDEEAFGAYAEVGKRFGQATDKALRAQVAKALVYKASRLEALSRSDAAIAAYEEVVARYADAAEPTFREQVEQAQTALRIIHSQPRSKTS